METVFKAIAAYFTLLLLLRVTGRRTGKRMAPFEILLIFLLGGQMTQSILAEDRSFTNAFIGVSTITLCHAFVAWIKTKSERATKVIDGVPMLIYANGQWEPERMQMVRIIKEDVLQHAREEGLEREDQIKYVIVERNGALSIIKYDS
jgi:uncharacterized membrane protein YcaP (DUF421 family)